MPVVRCKVALDQLCNHSTVAYEIFVATDGTKFEDRSAWRRYEFETNYTFRNKTNETLCKLPGKINGQPFDLSDLNKCEITLLDQCDQVQVDNVTESRVFIGPCSESVFVRNCSNCVFTVACKQLRTRDCTNCTFYLYSLTDPIIETSSEIMFAPFNGAYCGLQQHFSDARLEPTNNHWSQVYDFNDPDKSGRNWRLLHPQEECAAWVIDVEPHVPNAATLLGACTNPVPREAGFIQYEENCSPSTGTMQSFSFTTTQNEAEKVLATQPPPVVPAAACFAAPPALSMAPPPPAPLPPQTVTNVTAPSLPPPAPLQTSAAAPAPPAVEKQGVTENTSAPLTTKAPPVNPDSTTEGNPTATSTTTGLTPPMAAPTNTSDSLKDVEPAVDTSLEQATQKLDGISLGQPTPV